MSDAAALVFHRARLMQRATGMGRMLAVELPVEAAEEAIAAVAEEHHLGGLAHLVNLCVERRGLEL